MSKIQEMIDRICPGGVEYKRIKDVFTRIKGTPITATLMKEIASEEGDVRIFAGGKTVIDAKRESIPNANITTVPSLIVQSRGVIDFVFYDKPFTFKNEMWGYTHPEPISVKFLGYVLKNNVEYFRRKASETGSLPQISLPVTEEYEIPVPPLEVQREIVKVLDSFSEHSAALVAELDAELAARKKQYEYYRDRLLDLDNEFTPGIERSPLCSICYYPKGRISGKELNNDNYVSTENLLSGKKGKTTALSTPLDSCIEYKIDDILIGNIRPYLRKIWLANNNGGTNGDVVLIRRKDDFKHKISAKYLYYVLSSESFFNYDNSFSKGAKMPRGDKAMILQYELAVPPLDEQIRIVSILDKLEALTNSLSEGLPAEIKARQRQYEYYRDQLLTFKRAN